MHARRQCTRVGRKSSPLRRAVHGLATLCLPLCIRADASPRRQPGSSAIAQSNCALAQLAGVKCAACGRGRRFKKGRPGQENSRISTRPVGHSIVDRLGR
eukprot:scaffold307_cov390-Prasinococcus_capsulatus_cf.AAC.13